MKIVFLLVMLLASVPLAVGFDDVHHYSIYHDGKITKVSTNKIDGQSILAAAGVPLDKHDLCLVKLHDNRVDVIRAQRFTLVDQKGKTTDFVTHKQTVGGALKHARIKYQKQAVYPQPEEKLQTNTKIYLLAKNEKMLVQEEEIPYEVEYYNDDTLLFGEEIVGRPGKAGKLQVLSKSVRHSDGTVKITEIERRIVAQPEKKIVRHGTKQAVQTPEGMKRYSKKMMVHSTAYTINCGSGNGMTSIGLPARVGIVAVDPSVIPYYTKMYIPGYGIAIAGDCGGAINGNEVDVFVETYDAAIQWGRRNIEIYILEE